MKDIPINTVEDPDNGQYVLKLVYQEEPELICPCLWEPTEFLRIVVYYHIGRFYSNKVIYMSLWNRETQKEIIATNKFMKIILSQVPELIKGLELALEKYEKEKEITEGRKLVYQFEKKFRDGELFRIHLWKYKGRFFVDVGILFFRHWEQPGHSILLEQGRICFKIEMLSRIINALKFVVEKGVEYDMIIRILQESQNYQVESMAKVYEDPERREPTRTEKEWGFEV
jgi:hypothetical protein